jgi:hypothetical protein
VGLRLVALSAAIAAPLNVVVSIFFAQWYGAPGPLLASCIVCTVIQIIPVGWYANRRQRDAIRGVGRHRAERQRMVDAGLLPGGPGAGDSAPGGDRLAGTDAAPVSTAGLGPATSVADGVPAFEPIEFEDPPDVSRAPVPFQRGFAPRR